MAEAEAQPDEDAGEEGHDEGGVFEADVGGDCRWAAIES
jgi:hypothetical protein